MLHPPALVRGLWATTGMFLALTSCVLAAFALLTSESLHGDRAEHSIPNPWSHPVPSHACPKAQLSPWLSPPASPHPSPLQQVPFSKPARPNAFFPLEFPFLGGVPFFGNSDLCRHRCHPAPPHCISGTEIGGIAP